jgi:hypothetical protein
MHRNEFNFSINLSLSSNLILKSKLDIFDQSYSIILSTEIFIN